MNLTSCDNCGVVLDKDKLKFPADIYDSDDCIDSTKAVYSDRHDAYVPYVACPVCVHPVLEKS